MVDGTLIKMGELLGTGQWLQQRDKADEHDLNSLYSCIKVSQGNSPHKKNVFKGKNYEKQTHRQKSMSQMKKNTNPSQQEEVSQGQGPKDLQSPSLPGSVLESNCSQSNKGSSAVSRQTPAHCSAL